MQYKIYSYEINDHRGRLLAPDRHLALLDQSKGRDSAGTLSRYRGKQDAVLMAVRSYRSDFSGLIGRHSTEREITEYDEANDAAHIIIQDDDDYPHTAFICFPRLRTIACIDGSIKADSALSRLHAILAHRKSVFFTFQAFKEAIDLRKAVRRFKVTEISFEVLPVNPHTGPLGEQLDASRARDHVARLRGKAEGTKANPIKLNGGIMTAIQELQQSGHAKVGFRGYTESGVEVVVPKPKQTQELAEDEDETVRGEDVDVKINFPGLRATYPFDQSHVTSIRTIIRNLQNDPDDE